MTRPAAIPEEVKEIPTEPARVPDTAELWKLRQAAQSCRGCTLYARATCAVFGEGERHARLLFVGEQPGDAEDLAGKPFVGPAGKMLNRALEDAGIDRREVYVTNAVKHFKWEQRGKRRMHDKPNAAEVAACRPWLLAELRSVRPQIVVCLGATAAFSVLQRRVKVLENQGKILDSGELPVLITIHPSVLLRLRTSAERHQGYSQFVRDLRSVARS